MKSSTETSSNSAEIEAIVEKYLLEPCVPQEENPIEYWKIRSEEYYCITKIVPQYLCIKTSLAPVECIFSFASKIFRPERCCLTDKTFEKLMFIKCN